MRGATKATDDPAEPGKPARFPSPADPGKPTPSPPPAEPGKPAPSPPPAEPGKPAPSPPPAEPVEPAAMPANGDGGGNGKGGNGGGDGGGAPKPKREYILWIITVLTGVFSLVVALSFVGILWSLFWPYLWHGPTILDKTLLQLLADTETARGLITFLVAVSTVAIAVILVVYLAYSSAEVQVVKDRFAFSKEVLTSLIGILGTIIGFYFGASQDQTHGHGMPTSLTLAKLDITPPQPGKDGAVQATLSGGQSPYSYEIRLTQDTKTIKKFDDQAPNGTISQPIKLDDYDPAKPLDVTLEGTDATGAISGKQLHLPGNASPSTQNPSANKTN
jgi:hypothetical protein